MDYRTLCEYLILFITVIRTNADELSGDICEDLIAQTEPLEEMSKLVFYSHLPKGGKEAGTYLKVNDEVRNWQDCVILCCSNPVSCDVALYTLSVCYYIKCNETDASGCQPLMSPLPKHNSTVMVFRNIRQLESHDLITQPPTSGETSLTTTVAPSSTVASSSEAPSTNHKLVGQDCVYGMLECVIDAICEVKEDAGSKVGHCKCTEGFTETVDHLCAKTTDTGIQPIDIQKESLHSTTKSPIVITASPGEYQHCLF